jgi:hypothetical protein
MCEMESPSSFSVINLDRYFVFMVAENQFHKRCCHKRVKSLLALSGNFASRFLQAAKPEESYLRQTYH